MMDHDIMLDKKGNEDRRELMDKAHRVDRLEVPMTLKNYCTGCTRAIELEEYEMGVTKWIFKYFKGGGGFAHNILYVFN